jgi:hypothetical protein
MRFTFVHEVTIVVFFLPQNHGILLRHLDQHEPLAWSLRDDDLLAQAFLRNLDMKIIGRADLEGAGQEPYAQACHP